MYVIVEFDRDRRTASLVLGKGGMTKIFESRQEAYDYVCNNIAGPYRIVSLGSDDPAA